MACSSISPSSTPVFSSKLWKYHVFLSFRGDDTRQNFVGHLYKDLVKRGIHTYKDDETLPRGESISPGLMKAIEESQVAVIVFSKNYADSTWCLEELAHIMECKETRGQIVIPIFYGVVPSFVINLKEEYGEALAKHELKNKNKMTSLGQVFVDDPWGWLSAPLERKREYDEASTKYHMENKNKVEFWRKAIVDASNISGWSVANRDESKAIEEIVETISKTVHLTSVVDDNLIGMKARVQHLKLLLQIGLGGVRMIGIWGVGGGGKTTLASSIYNDISSTFDGCCFIKNVQEELSIKNGLENLQAEILSGILEQKQVKVGRVEEGRRMIKDRLRHRKVFIVLDDVDKLEQLEELARSRDWFGDGSRIIITTRDEHVLTGHKVDVIHNISLLNNDEAMKLFLKHAPRDNKPIKDYELYSKEVVSYAGGLPLALRVLGRFLCDKEMNEWRSALARLKEIPETNILEKLRISFDGLEPVERELFLDIACFFRKSWWYSNTHMMMTLDACHFHPVIGIKVLVQKALITISSDGRFDMHDLVEEMAHYIVIGEHPKNPAKHSRVWQEEDVLIILAMDASENFDKIEAIHVRYKSCGDSRILHVAGNMMKLRSIDLDNASYDESETTLSLFPDNFPPKELCCLTLSGLHIEQLWDGYKFLPNLRMIRLCYLKKLIKTPDFDGLPNLETFMVDDCWSLEEIDPSFGHLEKLLHVAIQSCLRLKMLPPITSSNIRQNMDNSLPHNMNHIGQWFFNGCLRKLNLRDCNLSDGLISAAVLELPNLQEIHLKENRFVRLNFSFFRLPRLKYLNVSFNKELVELSELPSSVAVVKADGCPSLKSFGDISKCKWLWKVSLIGNNKFGPRVGDNLLNSMLQENARDYCFSINHSGIDIWSGCSIPWVEWVGKHNMQLPHDWYNHFSGMLIFVNSNNLFEEYGIIMKQGVEEDFHPQLGQESNEIVFGTHYSYTFVGYVSFSSLRHTGCLNSTYNIISFSKTTHGSLRHYLPDCRYRVLLVPKDDPMQTTKAATDLSQFWHEEDIFNRKTFTIQHYSNSSVRILWHPSDRTTYMISPNNFL